MSYIVLLIYLPTQFNVACFWCGAHTYTYGGLCRFGLCVAACMPPPTIVFPMHYNINWILTDEGLDESVPYDTRENLATFTLFFNSTPDQKALELMAFNY